MGWLPGNCEKDSLWVEANFTLNISDARVECGKLKVGLVIRHRHVKGAMLIGFTTYTGKLCALFYETGVYIFLLRLRIGSKLLDELAQARLEYAIGMIYPPHTEHPSHCFLL
jgi:hypothetical protein